MNHRHPILTIPLAAWLTAAAAVAGLTGFTTNGVALAARAGSGSGAALSPVTGIPAAVKNKATLTAADQKAIDSFIAAHVERLSNPKASVQQRSRDELVAQVPSGGAGASPAYLTAYAQSLNRHLLPVVQGKDSPTRARLNAGIAASRVAARVNNTALSDVAAALLGDKAEPVALWGMKTARHIVPNLYRQGPPARGADKVTPAVLGAVRKFSSSAPMVEEAYETLRADVQDPEVPTPMLKGLADPVMDLMSLRVRQFATAALPPAPAEDRKAAAYLTFQKVWSQLSEKQKNEVVVLLCNYLSLLAQHAAPLDPSERAAIMPAFEWGGQAMGVIGTAVQGEGGDIDKTADAVAKISSQTDGEMIVERVEAACTAMVESGKFKDLKPPTIQVAPVDEETEEDPAAPAEGAGGRRTPAVAEDADAEGGADAGQPKTASDASAGAGRDAGRGGRGERFNGTDGDGAADQADEGGAAADDPPARGAGKAGAGRGSRTPARGQK